MGKLASLPKLEIILYFLVLISAITYATYHVYLASAILIEPSTNKYLSGSWFGYMKDITNDKWTYWMHFILHVLSKWVAGHVILTQLTRWFSPKYIPAVHCLTTMSFLCIHFGIGSAALMFLHAVFYFLVLQFNSVKKVWILGIPFATIFCYILYGLQILYNGEKFSVLLLMVSSMWQHLRCTSFAIDKLNSGNKVQKKIMEELYDLLGYCFYLPTYFIGPYILYSDFGPYMYLPFKKLQMQNIGPLVFNLLRYLFWAVVVEASLHFLYIHALARDIFEVAELGYWPLVGVGVLLGLFFNMKLIIFYGFGRTLATFDGYNPPPNTKCALHYHLYTDFWRVFDVGYYQYMKKYVYNPLCGGRRDWRTRLFASSVCFSFSFFWHGVTPLVIVWCLLNWLVVSIVALATVFSKSSVYNNWETHILSRQTSRRTEALLAAPILILSFVGSSFFLFGVHTGFFFLKEITLNCSWIEFGVGFFICYCLCQISMETKSWEVKKGNRK